MFSRRASHRVSSSGFVFSVVIQPLKEHCNHGLKRPSYGFCWQQTLGSLTHMILVLLVYWVQEFWDQRGFHQDFKGRTGKTGLDPREGNTETVILNTKHGRPQMSECQEHGISSKEFATLDRPCGLQKTTGLGISNPLKLLPHTHVPYVSDVELQVLALVRSDFFSIPLLLLFWNCDVFTVVLFLGIR